MNRISQHKILVTGDDYETACDQVRRFFDLTSLVIYDCIQPDPERSRSGLDADFFPAIARAEDINRKLVKDLLNELDKSGYRQLSDVLTLPQGYLSKTFHILSHLLDGFVGIDSAFYNLIDDSHWLAETTREQIATAPENFWLIHVDGYAATADEAGLLHL